MAKLYPISPPKIDLPKFKEQLKEVLSRANIGLFQLRLKDISEAEFLRTAEELLPICKAANIPFLINDSAEIALKCGADGVHIGEDDGEFEKARDLLGNKIIGVSCYNSLERAIEMADKGASYVSFGAFFPTTTKIAKSKAEIKTLVEFKRQRPNVKTSAIGGITQQNCQPLVEAGVDYLCMISGIWNYLP